MRCEQKDFLPPCHKENQDRLLLDTLDLPSSQLDSLSTGLQDLGLKKWIPPIPGPYTSLYFYTSEGKPIPFSIRARVYGVSPDHLTQGDIELGLDQLVVLEIKKKLGDHNQNKRKEIKYRQATRLSSALEAVRNLDEVPTILQQLHVEIPLGYPYSSIPSSILEEIRELNVHLEPAFTITSKRDHWIANEHRPDGLRITVDRDYFYHIIAEETEDGLIAHGSGIYPWVRSEIKVADEELLGLAEDVRQLIVKIGGFPPYTRGDAKRIYLEREFGQVSPFLPSRKAFSYELQSGETQYEMEGKINLAGEVDPESLVIELKNMFEGENREIYEVEPVQKKSYGLNEVDPDLRYTVTEHLVFGADLGTGELKQAFFITLNPSRPDWIGVKRKSTPSDDSNSCILLRTEERVDTPFSVLNQESLKAIIEKEKGHLGVDEVVYVGRFQREKWRFFVKNDRGRVYIIAVDRCKSEDEILHQIEIEYCLRRGVSVEEASLTKREIRKDIAELMDLVSLKFRSSGIRAESTSQTKFQWLLGLHQKE